MIALVRADLVVLARTAEVFIGDDRASLSAGGVAVVPQSAPHVVRNAGREPLRFVGADVVTRYDAVFEPDGGRERQAVS